MKSLFSGTTLIACWLSFSATATWTRTTSMHTARASKGSEVVLQDGRIVFATNELVECNSSAFAEVFDPQSSTWTETGAMRDLYYNNPATLLADGSILIVNTRSVASILDPSSLIWSRGTNPQMNYSNSTLTTLDNGLTFLIGRGDALYESYDISSGIWSCCGQMNFPRAGHTATVLLDGRILVSGGDTSTRTAEIYDPNSDTWSTTGPLVFPRSKHAAALLPDGRVLLVGGIYSSMTAEVFDPSMQLWTRTADVANRRHIGHALVTLMDGRVLLIGGNASLDSESRTELFDPSGGTWTDAGSLSVGRMYFLATLMQDGRALVAGGISRQLCTPDDCFPVCTETAEIFTPQQ